MLEPYPDVVIDADPAALPKELDDIVLRFGTKAVDGLRAGATTVAENLARVGASINVTNQLLGEHPPVSLPGLGAHDDLKNLWSHAPGGHLD